MPAKQVECTFNIYRLYTSNRKHLNDFDKRVYIIYTSLNSSLLLIFSPKNDMMMDYMIDSVNIIFSF